MRDILLALSVGAMFLYGYYLMKRVDDFLEEVRVYKETRQSLTKNSGIQKEENMVRYNQKGKEIIR